LANSKKHADMYIITCYSTDPVTDKVTSTYILSADVVILIQQLTKISKQEQ